MYQMKLLQLFSIKVSLLILLTTNPFGLKSQVLQSDLDALKSFYYATGGDQWINKTNWDMNANQNDVNNSWFGITVVNFRITKIKLSANNLRGHIPEDIKNLEMLQYFDISQNDIDSFSVAADNFIHLDTLLLSYNEFVHFPTVVCNFDSLRALELSLNKLTQIPPEIGQLKLLRGLKLNTNKIKSIPAEIKELKLLTDLDISNNPIKELIPEIFSLQNLRTLLASNDSLSSIPNLIKDLSNLRKIDFSYNQLQSIPTEMQLLTLINEINLSHNKLSDLPIAFNSFWAMQVLNLSYNLLTEFPAGISSLNYLKELQLQNNAISQTDDISKAIGLSRLSIENNKFGFDDLDSLHVDWSALLYTTITPQQYLPLSATPKADKVKLVVETSGQRNIYKWYKNSEILVNQNTDSLIIDTAESAVYYCLVSDIQYPSLVLQSQAEPINIKGGVLSEDYQALVDLYYATDGNNWNSSTNWLTADSVYKWKGISVKNYRVSGISLNNNNLTNELPASLAALNACESLNFTNNLLTNFPAQIGDMLALNRLDLSKNLLTEIPTQIGQLENLQILLLNNNQLTEIPDFLSGLDALQTLNLAFNKIETLPYSIGNLPNLQYLELNDNLLTTLPIEIGLLKKLWKLNLDNNRLRKIPYQIANLSELLMLYLSNNELDSLPRLDSLSKLSRIYLAGNYLDFGDFDADSLDFKLLQDAIYYPQRKFPLGIFKNAVNYRLNALVNGESNLFQWFKDSVLLNGEVNDTLLVSLDEKAVFFGEISNLNYPKLIIGTQSIHLPSLISVDEYNALTSLYESCNGDNWTNKSNWLSNSAANDWFGVEVENYKLKAISLPNNLLTGVIPDQIGQLVDLESLNLSGNNISGSLPATIGKLKSLHTLNLSNNILQGEVPFEIKNLFNLKYLLLQHNGFTKLPDLSGLTFLLEMNVADNQLDFGDLEPNIRTKAAFNYSPQAIIGESKEFVRFEGQELFLEVFTYGKNNSYQWFKDNEVLLGENAQSLFIENFNLEQVGTYQCKVTNSIVPDLELSFAPFVVKQLYRVKFLLNDARGKVKNAQIELENFGQKYSNIVGEAVFDSIASGAQLNYSIKAAEHNDFSDILVVDKQDVLVNVYLGITDIVVQEATKFTIYPNPVIDVLKIDLPISKNNSIWELSINDLNGKTLLKETILSQYYGCNLQSFSSGIYFVILKSSNGDFILHKIQKM